MKKIAERYMNSESVSEKAKLLEEGAALAQEILKKNQNDDSAHYMLAQDALKKKKYQNALDELNKAIALLYSVITGADRELFILNKEENLCPECHGLGNVKHAGKIAVPVPDDGEEFRQE